MHQRLDNFRENKNREFFHLSIGDAIGTLDQVCVEVDQLFDTSKYLVLQNLGCRNTSEENMAEDSLPDTIKEKVQEAEQEIALMTQKALKSFNDLNVEGSNSQAQVQNSNHDFEPYVAPRLKLPSVTSLVKYTLYGLLFIKLIELIDR